MPRISAAILARNEENNIRYCLESVKTWCDEIILVDMESEDRTVEIAREYTDKIFSHKIVSAFDIGKKFAVEKTSGNWVLIIDADEVVPLSLAEKLKRIASQETADIVYMPFKTFIMGAWIRHTMWWPEYHPRFFRKGSISFVETIHAYMDVPASAKKLILPATEQNAIYHFNYRDSQHFIAKLNKYTTTEAEHLFNRGIKFSFLRMFKASACEFYERFFSAQGFKDGHRGLFLSIMMAFYRILTHIKLWEKWEYGDNSPRQQYDKMRNILVADFKPERRKSRNDL